MLLVLVGLPGSGKSTWCEEFRQVGLVDFVRVSQDDLGDRKKCEKLAQRSLLQKKVVVIDRSNFSIAQRRVWLDIAVKNGVKSAALVFAVSPETCISRIQHRVNHPTLPPHKAQAVVNFLLPDLDLPVSLSEGFDVVYDGLLFPTPRLCAEFVSKEIIHMMSVQQGPSGKKE